MISSDQLAITHKKHLNNCILFSQIKAFIHITRYDISVFFSICCNLLPLADPAHAVDQITVLRRLLEPPEEAEAHTGWAKVALLDGRTGYVRDVALEPVRFEMTAVFSQREGLAFDDALAEARNVTAGELVPQALQAWYDGSEEAFRDAVCAQAKKYLGTEYRWGGKSGRGIDCSGLVSIVYMQCGVLIYRDARIVEGWPMHQIPFADKKRGDALYFPGHIALYLGEGRYIHSTGASVSGGVVINSLDPADPLYREDLVKCLNAVGSIF